MRHHGGADDADRDVGHAGLPEAGRQQGVAHLEKVGLRLRQHEDLDEVASADRRHQHEHDRFDRAHAESLQREQQEHVAGRDEHGPKQRNVETAG